MIVASFSVSRCSSSIGGISRLVGGRKSASVAVRMLPVSSYTISSKQRIADALRDAAKNLAVDDHRIDQPAGILGHHEPLDDHPPRVRIDLDDAGMTGIRERAGRIVGRGFGNRRIDFALEEMNLVIGGARQPLDR